LREKTKKIIINILYMDETLKKINKLYENVGFMDTYGNSVILFIFLSMIVFFIFIAAKLSTQSQDIKDDWVNQRCKPYIIPFAGFINKPPDKTVAEYTKENFAYCLQGTTQSVAGYAMQPITYTTNILGETFTGYKTTIDSIRVMMDTMRNNLKGVAQEVMGRIMNVMIPLQQIIIGFRDSIGKVQASLVTGMYTSLGTYYTLKSALGALVNFITLILIILVAMIVPLLAFPLTVPMAMPLIATFTAVAIPLSIILVVLSQALGIKPDNPIPHICFDKETRIELQNGIYKTIQEICVGDVLLNDGMVTAKMIFNAKGAKMYNYKNIIVSDSHYVYDEDEISASKWRQIKNCKKSVVLSAYNENYIYCLNTEQKTITINGICFSDYDDLFTQLEQENYTKQMRENIHRYYDGGFDGNTEVVLSDGSKRYIKNIEPGTELVKGISVVGLVEVDGMYLKEQGKLLINDNNNIHLGKIKTFRIGGNVIHYGKKGKKIFSQSLQLELSENNEKQKKVFHLITDTGAFWIEGVHFMDYNSCIDEKFT
jgi:hypothetical protein